MYKRQVYQNGRTFDTFLTELKQKSKTCEFGNICDSLVRDRVVWGVDSNSTRERLLREPGDLTLEKATQVCRSSEQCKIQSKTFSGNGNPKIEKGESVDSLGQSRRGKKSKSKDKSKDKQRKEKVQTCPKCGYSHSKQDKCPAKGLTCRNCNKRNHFASVCRSEKQGKVYQVYDYDDFDSSDDDDSNEDLSELHIDEIGRKKNHAIYTDLVTNESESVHWKIDTGAGVNVIGPKTLAAIGARRYKTKRRLTSYGGKKLPVLGKCKVRLTHPDNRSCKANIYVVDIDNVQPLLGLKSSLALKLVKLDESVKICSVTYNSKPSKLKRNLNLNTGKSGKLLKSVTKNNGCGKNESVKSESRSKVTSNESRTKGKTSLSKTKGKTSIESKLKGNAFDLNSDSGNHNSLSSSNSSNSKQDMEKLLYSSAPAKKVNTKCVSSKPV